MLVERALVHNLPDNVLVKATSNYITNVGYYHALSIISSAIMPKTSKHEYDSASAVTAIAVAVATTSTAALIGVIAGYYYRSRTAMNDREMKTTKIPNSLLQSEYHEELKLAVHLVMQGTISSYCDNRSIGLDIYDAGVLTCIFLSFFVFLLIMISYHIILYTVYIHT